jgi:tetratricopeptide (TPR) repeat protein
LGKYEKALDHLLTSIGINFYNYIAHFNIGRTLIKIGDYENGANSMEIALRINPNFGFCRNSLIELYETQFLKPERAEQLRERTERNELKDENSEWDKELIIHPSEEIETGEPIIVVSGLPRSGTSMMMQILEAAGIPIYSDGKRQPDESNPNGYYEHEKVKLLIQNNRWMNEAKGKAVKIVVPLLYKIPKNFTYKVIFMLRDMDEIIDSQHKMLVRSGKRKDIGFDFSIKEAYSKYISQKEKWIVKNPNIEILFVRYEDAINNPQNVLQNIRKFLNISFDINQTAKIVLPQLYRIKK